MRRKKNLIKFIPTVKMEDYEKETAIKIFCLLPLKSTYQTFTSV